jgi:hypothetical protein
MTKTDTWQTRPLVKEGAHKKTKTVTLGKKKISGQKSQIGLDTKTYWLTGRQSQCDCDCDFDFDLSSCTATEHKLETYLSWSARIQASTHVLSESTAPMRVRLSIMMTGNKHCGSRAMTVRQKHLTAIPVSGMTPQCWNYVNFNLISGHLRMFPNHEQFAQYAMSSGWDLNLGSAEHISFDRSHLFCDYGIVSRGSSVGLATSWMTKEPEFNS